MNKKLIAAAVSAAVIAPVAAQAESEFYGSIRNVIDIKDVSSKDDAESTTDISSMASRLGFKGDTDIGNGMTAHGRYEFSTSTDKEEEGVEDIRIATVGLSGSFGRVDIGNQWSSFYNSVGTFISPTYSLGYYMYTGVGGGLYRSSNTIKYSNSFGPLSAQLDVRLNDSDEGSDVAEAARGNGMGLGLTYSVTDKITIAAAFDSEEGADRDKVDAVTYAAQIGTAGITAKREDLGRAATAADVKEAADAYTVVDTDGAIIKEVSAVAAVAVGDTIGAVTAVTNATPAGANYLPEVEGVRGHAADSAPDTDRVALAVNADFGFIRGSLGWYNYSVDDDGRTIHDDEVDVDTIYLWVGGDISEKTSWNVGYSKADDGRDARDTALTAEQATAIGGSAEEGDRLAGQEKDVEKTSDSVQLTWGIYHNMGGGMRLFYEATNVDSQNNEQDGDQHLLGMRFDF